jgi:hypothetical protein
VTWLRDDDDMLDHEKWRRAIRDGGDSALYVWSRLRAWCSRRLTDGIVPGDLVDEVAQIGRSKARARALRALIEHGLCARREHDAIAIVGYLERNPSKAEVLADRERRAEAQRNRRKTQSVTGHGGSSVPERAEVPARPGPIPSPMGDPERAREEVTEAEPRLPEVERRVAEAEQRWGAPDGKTYTIKGLPPTESYLASAVMAGVSREQAQGTWTYYATRGLPPGGLEDAEGWLVRMAVERRNQLATVARKAAPASPRPGDDLDTTGAATRFRPNYEHRDFAEAHLPGRDIDALARECRAVARFAKLAGSDRDREFMARLRCLAATGRWIPEGPLPKGTRKAEPQPIKPEPKESRP